MQLAWNCRTSIEMIEKYYARHIKTRVDAAAINVGHWKKKQKAKPKRRSRAANDNRKSWKNNAEAA